MSWMVVRFRAICRSARPARRRGLRVSSRVTFSCRWKMQRWMRVSGQVLARAERIPEPPSVTTTAGGGDLGEQGLPGGGGLPSSPLPGDDGSGGGLGDQQAPGADPDTIDQDRIMNLAGNRHPRLQLPTPGCCAAEGAPAVPGELGLGRFPGQPGQEPAQLLPLAHIGPATHRGCAAVPAPPALRAGRVTAILHQPCPAYHAGSLIQGKVHD